MICDKCGSPVNPKEITAKATGKKFTVMECSQEKGDCFKEGTKFRYSFFPPRVKSNGAPKSVSRTYEEGAVLMKLDIIIQRLDQILLMGDPLEKEARK